MGKVFVFVFILTLHFFSLYANDKVYKGQMGYLVDGLNDVKYKDARIAFDLWVADLAKGEGVDVSIKYYDTVDMMREDYKNFVFDYITLNTYYLLKNKDIFYDLTKEFWSVQKGDERYEEYLILVHKGSKIKRLKDLKAKTLALRNEDYMGRMILDKELLETVEQSSKKYLNKRIYVSKFSTAILQTYFGKIDACVVPSYSLKTVAEMNPDILNKARILYKSKKIFLPIIGGFHKKTDEELLKRFGKKVTILFQTVRGQNILDLFKMKKLIRINKTELSPIFDYYKEYILLKKKYHIKEEKI